MQSTDLTTELMRLDEKVNSLLPPRYLHCYADVSPTSMGSAGLVYDSAGRVAWDRIWTTFCDLALAGGPPHRGSLLEPVSEADALADPERQAAVVAEIDRAVGLTVAAAVVPGYAPGWIGIPCGSVQEAAWLQLAVTAENVSARRRENVLQLPAGPAFRVEKEIKNVVVALTKTLHYWDGHLTDDQQTLASDDVWEAATPTEAAAAPSAYEAVVIALEESLRAAGLTTSPRRNTGWVGVETSSEEEAGWLLRALLVERILVRREEAVLYLPVNAELGSDRVAHMARLVTRAQELWVARSPRRFVWKPSDSSK